MEEGVLSQQVIAVASCLRPRSIADLRAASRTLHQDTVSYLLELCERELLENDVSDVARDHYRELLGVKDAGVGDALLFLHRRRLLLAVDTATKYSQWRTQTAVARLMNSVHPDGSDLFAALRRTFLASQVPELASSTCVVRWMHVLDAVEETDPVHARLAAAEAWRALAKSVTAHSLLWVVQTAHFLDALPDLVSWLSAENGLEAKQLHLWLAQLETQLSLTPILGRYGPYEDTRTVRARHVARLTAVK